MISDDRSDWLDRYHGAKHGFRPIIERLNTLSYAFDMVGNTKVADELAQMAINIAAIDKQISNAVSDNLHENVASSMSMTGLLLKATMAGVIGGAPQENRGSGGGVDW